MHMIGQVHEESFRLNIADATILAISFTSIPESTAFTQLVIVVCIALLGVRKWLMQRS
jgi:hypothetical protein